jgi:hypothetical protein
MRLNCNNATGTWSVEPGSDGISGRFEFSPLAMTRALCPPPSMDEFIALQSEHIRSYLLKDGKLYLSLMADGGIFAWEPDTEKSTASPSTETVLAKPTASPDLKLALQDAIAQFMQAENIPSDGEQTFLSDFVDLNGDSTQDAVVVLTGFNWCGTGGCTMLVFQGKDKTFKFVSSSSLVRPPVTVSETKTKGWRDLVLTVSGGGIPARTVALKFDGKQYPLNPSIQTALPAETAIKGTVLFPEGTHPEALPKIASQGHLKSYDEPTMAIATKYPDTMTVIATCSGEGCGYFFKFKPQNSALDQSEVHLFLPAGANTAADAAIGLDSLMQSNNWKKDKTATPAPEFNYPWVKKILLFSAEQGLTGHILIGETNNQGVRATLLYPNKLSKTFIPAAKTVLDNLQFKPDKLPITTQG